MKLLKRVVVFIGVLAVLIAGYVYWVTGSVVPDYSGEKTVPGMKETVTCTFDEFGIPCIEAGNAEDAYRTLGYVMASERLFQMELLRRVGKGTLAEALGRPGLEPDVFFRTAGIAAYAKSSAQNFLEEAPESIQKECAAFIEGINAFQEKGELPLEFQLAGLKATPYNEEDLFAIAGYMAYSFSLGVRTDLLANDLVREHGEEWLHQTGLFAEDLPPFHPNCEDSLLSSIDFIEPLESIGIPAFKGSNAWALSGTKTKSGDPMLCNDTHIGYAVPQVWYEASVHYPGFSTYGNFIPGVPYALIGHGKHHAWGVTMLENDDIDFYRERRDEAGGVLKGNTYYAPEYRRETIAIAGEKDTTFQVVLTEHGPIINGAVRTLDAFPPISMRWDYTQFENKLIHAFRGMAHARDMVSFEKSLSNIHGPGVNIVYADDAENIAWWGCAALVIQPEGVNPKSVIDGSSPENNILGYKDFSRNPSCKNPASGFVYSANERPVQLDSVPIFGYYVPPSRGERIASLLSNEDDWDTASLKEMMLDVTNSKEAEIAHLLQKQLMQSKVGWSDFEEACIALLDWDGAYGLTASTPVLYQPLQIRLLESGMRDKLSEEQFARYCETHWMRRGLHIMLLDPDHPVWDVSTTEPVETIQFHLERIFPSLCTELSEAFGTIPENWQWGEAHTWGPKHIFADQPIIGEWLSFDPVPMYGSNETISQSGFNMTTDIRSHALFGAQMRIVHDLADVENSWSVTPTGQSGHKRSPHFADQAGMYVNGTFRKQHFAPSKNGKILRLK